MRVAILTHELFPHRAKTAIGILRYGDQTVAGVIDRELAGTTTTDHSSLVPEVPIVSSMDDVEAVDALVIGVAPIGGTFDESWRPDVRTALERGCTVISGLHDFLGDDEEFAALAAAGDAAIEDVRRPPDDLTVSKGIADEVDATVVLTVGTDASIGKMTTSVELVAAARERGIDAALVPTGQTGIMIEGWGLPIDRVPVDFVNGAVERMILDRGDQHDLLVVEGQGSINHPAYSGLTCGILHGAQPDGLILCTAAHRDAINGYDSYPIPPLAEVAEIYETVAEPIRPTNVIGAAVNTRYVDDHDRAAEHVAAAEEALSVPATDVVKFGADPLVEAIERLA